MIVKCSDFWCTVFDPNICLFHIRLLSTSIEIEQSGGGMKVFIDFTEKGTRYVHAKADETGHWPQRMMNY